MTSVEAASATLMRLFVGINLANPKKKIVWHRLEKLQLQVVKDKIRIENFTLLKRQLTHHNIRFNPQLNPFCWVFNLLEQKKSTLTSAAELGLEIRSPYAHLSLQQLFDQLNSTLYKLSVAHFDLSQTRHLASPAINLKETV